MASPSGAAYLRWMTDTDNPEVEGFLDRQAPGLVCVECLERRFRLGGGHPRATVKRWQNKRVATLVAGTCVLCGRETKVVKRA
jgi:hypothetical protein